MVINANHGRNVHTKRYFRYERRGVRGVCKRVNVDRLWFNLRNCWNSGNHHSKRDGWNWICRQTCM